MWVEVDTPVEGVAVITMSRPPVNALNRGLREELLAAVDALRDRADVRAVVLTATGKIFCAGADIKEKASLAEGGMGQTAANRLTRELFFAFAESEKPVIAAVNGAAVGAGFVLAASCDIILAADEAVFAMPEIDVGQGGGASVLKAVIPRGLLRRLVLTGERVRATELHRLGVVDSCVPAGELLDAAVTLATTIARKNPAAVAAIKTSFTAVDVLPAREGFRVEQSYTTALSNAPEAVEARRAFFESRHAPRHPADTATTQEKKER